MSASKHIDKICMAAAALMLLTAVLMLMYAEVPDGAGSSAEPAYADRLFDTDRVHTVDIVMDDWADFLAGCTDEEYVSCAVVIDGEVYRNVGFRAKGNTSLTAVERMGSSRYSFKIEFDHYDRDKSFYGLDKLCLNNIIQDNTYLKDYLSYTAMADAGVAAPLCSFAFLTVNGEDWGLYLAVEGVEEAFLRRNFGRDWGALYKPGAEQRGVRPDGEIRMPGGAPAGRGAPGVGAPEDGVPGGAPWNRPPEGAGEPPPAGVRPGNRPQGPGGLPDGGGDSDLCLRYSGDSAEDYPNIFDHAKTDVTQADRQRVVAALKSLSEGRAAEAVDVEQVIRYFAAHSFLCNDDSYTGVMAHNYYLYEKDGRLSMIPWDYNLAFGGFGMTDAAGAVNAPIDTPVTGAALEDRPMVSWIFADEDYTELYHRIYGEFLQRWFAEGKFAETVDRAAALIAPYVERDPTKFCTADEFETGVAALREFCRLRAESVQGQLDGSIPATAAAQAADPAALVDAGKLNLSDMGGMNR